MIRKTLNRTKKATFQIRSPSRDPNLKEFPMPVGAGFFISKDGYFLTANHIVENFVDIDKVRLEQPSIDLNQIPTMLEHISTKKQWPNFDIALLKVNFNQNREKVFLKGKKGFPFLTLDANLCEEGTPIYSFAYPLSKPTFKGIGQPIMIAFDTNSPRVTSAIISSQQAYLGSTRSSNEPVFYAIDKALNYGNSGGPIVSTETGKVVALCTRFQPVTIPQPPTSQLPPVTIPSLYGVVSALWNIRNEIQSFLDEKTQKGTKKIVKKKKEFKPKRRRTYTSNSEN